MIVRFGRTVESGFLLAYSVDTEQEALDLLTSTCSTNNNNEFVARELIHDQTVENLWAFGERLKGVHQGMKERKHE